MSKMTEYIGTSPYLLEDHKQACESVVLPTVATKCQCLDGVMVNVSDSKSRVHGFEPDCSEVFFFLF